MAAPRVKAVGAEAPFQVRLSDGSHTWLGDEPADVGGGDTGPGPQSLLLSALGACTAITVRMYAGRKGWPLEGIEVDLAYGEAEPGTAIERRITLRGPLDETQRARLLDIANRCPVHKILSGPIAISTALED
jgi:putative redox protein